MAANTRIQYEKRAKELNDQRENAERRERDAMVDGKPNCEQCFLYWAHETNDGVKLTCSYRNFQRCPSYKTGREQGLFKTVR